MYHHKARVVAKALLGGCTPTPKSLDTDPVHVFSNTTSL